MPYDPATTETIDIPLPINEDQRALVTSEEAEVDVEAFDDYSTRFRRC